MRTWIARRPVTAYYILAVTLTWGYWITLIAQGKHSGPGSSTSHLPGLLGPLISAFMITAIIDGGPGVADLLRRMVRWRWPTPWVLLVTLSPFAIAALTFAILVLLGTPLPPLQEFQLYPGLPASLPFWAVLVLVLIVNGYGEEVGWRGFMMERLVLRYDRFRAALIIAGLWIVWHIPVFWINVTMTALVGPMLLGWALGVACGAFVLAHVYLMSNRSILAVALWHALYNMVVAPPAGAGIPAAVVSTVVMVWGVVIAWKWWRESRRKQGAPH